MKELDELKEKFYQIKEKGWIQSATKGNSGVGTTFEKQLGKDLENFEIPDYNGIEIKTKYSNKENYITLFSAAPDSYLFEIKRIHHLYGYPDKEFPQYNIFNLAVYSNKKVTINQNNYFELIIDYKQERIYFNVYNQSLKLIDNLSSWSFNMLKEKLYKKLKYLLLVKAERKYQDGIVYFRYKEAKFYKIKNFELFLKLIESRKIRVCFKIGIYKSGKKLGELHDHGTSFSIEESELEKLFTLTEEFY